MNSDDDSAAYTSTSAEDARDYDGQARFALKMSKVPLLVGGSWLALYGVEHVLYRFTDVRLGGLLVPVLWVPVLVSVFLFTLAVVNAKEVVQSKVGTKEAKKVARKAIDISTGGVALMVLLHVVFTVVFIFGI